MRPLVERRAKHAALRDVAGMLRSFSYAVAAASRALPQDLPLANRQAVQRRLATWEVEASEAFLDAYFEAARGGGFFPEQRADADRVVRFFMLEKALYEIAYELANRPDWVAIPLRGVLSLLDAENMAATTRKHHMPFGAEPQADGRVRFRLWAPPHREVRIELEGATAVMEAVGEGWHELVTDRARPGTRYRFVLPNGLHVPDPASRYQPEDVHGPSEVIDPAAYVWRDAGWTGRPWGEAVVYELHIGAFTPEGTFRAAIGKLDHLVALGVTGIEIMPIGDFPGRRNWGYDGVLPYAPDSSYGRPEDLKALVEAAHARGLMVLLDVVYNHFGPEGAYIHAIAPQTFTDRHKTPWGAAINFDGPESGPVREFVIHNALYWIEEFHLDGLRLDAVHAIHDDSPKQFLEELAERVRAAMPDRHIHLILENEENQAKRLARGEDGEPRWYTAQWNDDVHHALHVAASGETKGYYADYKGDTEKLGRALAEGFAFQGEVMPYRGHPRGELSADLPPTAFVAFIQNHDQVGNRACRRSPDRFRGAGGGARDLQRPICCCRRSRCCSWARNGVPHSPFRSSATSGRSSRMRCAKDGETNSRAFRSSRIRKRASESPTQRRRRPSPPPNSAGKTSSGSLMPAGSTGIAGFSRHGTPRSCRGCPLFGKLEIMRCSARVRLAFAGSWRTTRRFGAGCKLGGYACAGLSVRIRPRALAGRRGHCGRHLRSLDGTLVRR